MHGKPNTAGGGGGGGGEQGRKPTHQLAGLKREKGRDTIQDCGIQLLEEFSFPPWERLKKGETP